MDPELHKDTPVLFCGAATRIPDLRLWTLNLNLQLLAKQLRVQQLLVPGSEWLECPNTRPSECVAAFALSGFFFF